MLPTLKPAEQNVGDREFRLQNTSVLVSGKKMTTLPKWSRAMSPWLCFVGRRLQVDLRSCRLAGTAAKLPRNCGILDSIVRLEMGLSSALGEPGIFGEGAMFFGQLAHLAYSPTRMFLQIIAAHVTETDVS